MRPSSILALALLLPLLASPSFGAPSDDPRPIVPASEILAKIERGEPVEYDGVIVVGDLDLSGLDLPTKHVERSEDEIIYWRLTEEVKVVESPIKIANSKIRGNVNLGNTIFQGPINFVGTIFSGNVDFRGADFSGNVDFRGADFSANADFRGADFSANADFGGTNFSGDADFRWANFSGYADFGGSNFSGYANFLWAYFNWNVSFWRTNFSGNANFLEANFSGNAYFGGANFSGYANFGGADFSCGADFGGANFSGYADFGGAEFSADADFNGANFCGGVYFNVADFSGDADFRRANFSGDANFIGAEFSGYDVYFDDSSFDHTNSTLEYAKNIRNLRLSNANFDNLSTICLNDADYERLYVHWDSIEDALVYNGEVYLNLIKSFKAIEYFEDADDCYYKYRRERQSMRSWREVAKYTDILGWVTCGYGVRPGYTLLLGFFVVSISAVYYWRKDAIRRLKGDEDESAKFSDAFYFSMMTFTTVGYGDWYPQDRHRNVVMIEGIVGWLTLSLFLVTLANVIIR